MSSNVLYIKIKSGLLSVRNVTSGAAYEDIPEVALSENRKSVLDVGAAAARYANDPKAVVVNGFQSPRSIIGDFEAAEKALQAFIKRVAPERSWWNIFPFVPVMVIHPLEKVQDGLTQVEARALEDLCWRARAADVYVWTGRLLMDDEVLHLNFSGNGTLYNRKA